MLDLETNCAQSLNVSCSVSVAEVYLNSCFMLISAIMVSLKIDTLSSVCAI